MIPYTEELVSLLSLVAKTPGAVSVTEMCAVHIAVLNNLKSLDGSFADLGSHAGKSTLAAAAALHRMNAKGKYYLVDPLYGFDGLSRGELEFVDYVTIPWAHASKPDFNAKVLETVSSVNDTLKFDLRGTVSSNFFVDVPDMFSYLFVDTGDHSAKLLQAELEHIRHRVLPGGLVMFHDYGNQYTAPYYAMHSLIDIGHFEQIDMNWPQAQAFVEIYCPELERDNDSWHNRTTPYPTFVGCIRRRL